MSEEKSIGTRVGKAIDKAKDTLGNAAESVEQRVKGAGDRASADAHDARAETSDNPFEKVEHKVKGAVDRAEADTHDARADLHEERAERAAKRDD